MSATSSAPTEQVVADVLAADISEVFTLPAADVAAAAFRDAEPFPHLVIDDFIRAPFVDAVRSVVLADDTTFARTFDDDVQAKKTISTGDDVPLVLQAIATKLGSAPTLRWLEAVTGHAGLIPDPYFNTEVGYYHIMGPGGVLASHIDHSHHASLRIPHVLNIVLYISPEWRDDDGGRLHLYDRSGRTSKATVGARFNRAVLFASNPIAYHGVEPLAASAPTSRHSLYFAYYLVSPSESVEGTPALQGRIGAADGQDVLHPTYFVVSRRDLLKRQNWPYLRGRLELAAKMALPPIVPALVRRVRRARRS